jgi:hypothetical protein
MLRKLAISLLFSWILRCTGERRYNLSMSDNGYAPPCEAYLLILSTISSKPNRAAVRAGWLSNLMHMHHPMKFQYKFVVGHEPGTKHSDTSTKLRSEIEQYKDILVLPFDDHYWNLTVKVSLMFKWPTIVDECKVIFKIDDDVHIRANRFTAMIRNLPKFAVYGGYVYDEVNRTSRVSRDVKNHHSFTMEEMPEATFRPYAGGPVYFMSSSVAKNIPYTIVPILKQNGDIECVPDTYLDVPRPPLYKLEDAYLGTLVGMMNHSAVTFWHIKNFFAESRFPSKTAIALHGIKDLSLIRHGYYRFG